uniref:Uncharacterized protein n=1 Tax=Anguilla anguilla TaxID=7936 RepID=A0A0E9XMK3_ANGAN
MWEPGTPPVCVSWQHSWICGPVLHSDYCPCCSYQGQDHPSPSLGSSSPPFWLFWASWGPVCPSLWTPRLSAASSHGSAWPTAGSLASPHPHSPHQSRTPPPSPSAPPLSPAPRVSSLFQGQRNLQHCGLAIFQGSCHSFPPHSSGPSIFGGPECNHLPAPSPSLSPVYVSECRHPLPSYEPWHLLE